MKLLFVYGDDDYAAMDFESSPYSAYLAETWDSAWESADHTLCTDEGFYVKAYKFGPVDPEFVTFIEDEMSDYDVQKGRNFFIVEE